MARYYWIKKRLLKVHTYTEYRVFTGLKYLKIYVMKGCERKYVMERGFVNVYKNISISEKKLSQIYEKYLKIIFHSSTK